MAPLPSRKDLQSMKRIDIQNLCKEYGVRANLKTEKLIDLLIETQSAPSPAATAPTRRSVSRQSSRGAGPSRTASIIIHDIEEEEPGSPMDTIQEEVQLDVEGTKSNQHPQPIRTRKAKDLQTKLGVGRPAAAGGSGARAVTKSTSVPRGRRRKSSRTLSRVDATIPEVAEPSSSGPTRSQSEQPGETSTLPLQAPRAASTPPLDVSRQISDALRPLQLKVESLEEELRNSQRRNQDLERIQAQLASVANLQQRYDTLQAEVRELRSEKVSIASLTEEFRLLKASLTSHPSPMILPTTPKARSPPVSHEGLGLGFPSAFKTMGFHPLLQTSTPTAAIMHDRPQTPGEFPTTLGKRARSSSASGEEDCTDANLKEDEDAPHEAELAGVRPEKKRAKLDSGAQQPHAIAGPSKPRVPTSEVAAQLLAPRMPTFMIFQGREAQVSTPYAHSTPPPVSSLPEVYRPSSPPGAPLLPPARTVPSRVTSSATNTENQRHTFDISIFGVNNGNESSLQPIPFPDAPQSPTPASHNIGFMNQLDQDRTDPFKEFGFPSPRRPNRIASNSEHTSGQGKDSAASSQIAAGLGSTMVRIGMPTTVVESTPSRRTLYGTELEGDSRFGDFGVEGIGSGFWTR